MRSKPEPTRKPQRISSPSAWLALALMAASNPAIAQAPVAPQASAIDGIWLTPKKDAVIEIAPCQGQDTRCARIVWIRLPAGKSSETIRDLKNPKPELQARELCGLEIITGLKPVAVGSYDGAVLYDPEEGQTVTGAAKRVGPNVKITGYLASFGPLLSESQVLTPVGRGFIPCVAAASATTVPAALSTSPAKP